MLVKIPHSSHCFIMIILAQIARNDGYTRYIYIYIYSIFRHTHLFVLESSLKNWKSSTVPSLSNFMKNQEFMAHSTGLRMWPSCQRGISMGFFHPIEIIGSVKNHWCIMLSSPEISREPLVLSWNFITNNSAVMFIKRSGLPAPRHRFFQVICWPLMACERRRAVELKNHRSWGYPNIYSHDFFHGKSH